MIDLIAEADIILAGGHLPASELHILFDEAARRGVKKMMVNHPTYIVGCSDTDIRQLVARGVMMEHSICMFIEGKSLKYSPDDLAHLIEVAGVDNTILSSDLGLQGLAASGRWLPQHHADPARSADAARRDQEAHQRQRRTVPESSGEPVGGAGRRLS
mgnify:CR=1 FL=1